MFTKLSSLNEIQFKLDKLPRNQQIFFAADCARSVLHVFENKHQNDNRPRLAIESAESLQYDSKIAAAVMLRLLLLRLLGLLLMPLMLLLVVVVLMLLMLLIGL